MTFDKPNREVRTFFNEALISGIAAVISKTLTSPIEPLILQYHFGHLPGVQDGYYNLIHQISKKWWSNNNKTIVRYASFESLCFGLKELLTRNLGQKAVFSDSEINRKFFQNGLFYHLSIGGLTGILAISFVYPLDLTRIKMENDMKNQKRGLPGQYYNHLHVFQTLFKYEGLRGFYNGFLITAIKISIFKAFYFGLFDRFKPAVTEAFGNEYFAGNLLLGIFVTSVAEFFSYPFDTIRRRLLMNSYIERYSGIIDCAKKIHGRQGLRSLYSGFGIGIPRWLTGAFTLALYERGRKFVFTKQVSQSRGY